MIIKKKKTILLALIALSVLIIFFSIFLSKKGEYLEKFYWGSAMSDGYKWPIVVNNAMFYDKEGTANGVTDFGEQDAPLTGKWAIGNGDSINTDERSLPVSLTARWFSIREKTWFEGDFKMPAKLDSIFKKTDGKQFILGFGDSGNLVVWLKGKLGKIELARFKGKSFDPDYELLGYSKFVNETTFLDSMYSKISLKERDEINALQPLADEKAVNGIYTGIYQFIAEQRLGKEINLIANKLTDTMFIIVPHGLPGNYEHGDVIKVSWKMEKRTNPKDTLQLIDRQIAIKTSLFKRGKLHRALIKGLPTLTASYNTEKLTNEGKLLMRKLVKEYLATSNDIAIRKAVEVIKKPIHFAVHEHLFNGSGGYRIEIMTDSNNPDFSKNVYFHSSKIFELQEHFTVKHYEN